MWFIHMFLLGEELLFCCVYIFRLDLLMITSPLSKLLLLVCVRVFFSIYVSCYYFILFYFQTTELSISWCLMTRRSRRIFLFWRRTTITTNPCLRFVDSESKPDDYFFCVTFRQQQRQLEVKNLFRISFCSQVKGWREELHV